MIKAIVYTTTTGTTEWYAKRLGEEIKLPVFTLKEAERELEKGAEILHLGSKISRNMTFVQVLFCPFSGKFLHNC